MATNTWVFPSVNGQSIPSTTPTLTWLLAGLDPGETQYYFTVSIDGSGGGRCDIHYFQTFVSNDQFWTVPVGLLADGCSYSATIIAHTTLGRALYATVPADPSDTSIQFNTGAPVEEDDSDPQNPCGGDITGLRVRAIGGTCSGEDTFPVLRLQWDQIVPCAGDDFLSYVIHRREAGDTDWQEIGTVDAIGTTLYDDATPTSGITYEYSVIWTADQLGNTVESGDVAPVTGIITYDFLWLHPFSDPSVRIRFDSHNANEQIEQDITYIRAWGRLAPTAFFGEQQSKRISVSGLPNLLTRRQDWKAMEEMLTLQRNGDVIVARFGRSRMKMFCIIDKASRQHNQKTQEPRIDLVEVSFSEARGYC